MKEYWRLVGKFGGTTFDIFGTEEVLRGALEAWLSWARMCEIERETSDIDPMLVIEGYYDSFDRAPQTIALRLCDIESMALTRM